VFRGFFGRHDKLAATLIGIFFVAGLLGTAEIACRIVEFFRGPPYVETRSIPDFCTVDADLGSAPKRNTSVTETKTLQNGKPVFHATYTIDALGRRVTPVEAPSDRRKFMLFFGCSFVFGEGLNDDQTLPYFIARGARCYTPYNYAFIGYGPQQTATVLQDGRIKSQVHEHRGLALYGFMGEPGTGHIDRAIGALAVFDWTRYFPFYHLDDAGELRRDGNFVTGRPVRSWAFKVLTRSTMVRLLGLNYPVRLNDDHIRLTATIIAESDKAFRKEFPEAEGFFVVIFPGAERRSCQKLKEILEEKRVGVLDYSQAGEFGAEDYRIESDGHPSEKWNRRLAQIIVNDLKLGDENGDCPFEGAAPSAR
jgi:hypothetical protein